MGFDPRVPVPEGHGRPPLRPERGELDDAPDAHIPGRIYHTRLVLDLTRLVGAREEDAFDAFEGAEQGFGIAEVAYRQLDAISEHLRGFALVPHQGTDG